MDANAYNEVWGSVKTDKRGEELLEFILANDITIANVGSKPTFCTLRNTRGGLEWAKSVIDLTIVSNFICDLIEDWKVEDDDSYSDHKYLLSK